jgi:hypothetical protein
MPLAVATSLTNTDETRTPMPDLPIAPDESSGEPRCQRDCPSWGSTDAVRYGHCAHPEQGTQRVIGDMCHPRVRELVAENARLRRELEQYSE